MQHFSWKKMSSIDNCFTSRGAVFGDVVERELCFNLIFQNLFKVCCFWLCQGLSSRSLKCIRIQPSYQNLILSQSVQFTVYVRIGFCRFHFYITKAFKKDQFFHPNLVTSYLHTLTYSFLQETQYWKSTFWIWKKYHVYVLRLHTTLA